MAQFKEQETKNIERGLKYFESEFELRAEKNISMNKSKKELVFLVFLEIKKIFESMFDLKKIKKGEEKERFLLNMGTSF